METSFSRLQFSYVCAYIQCYHRTEAVYNSLKASYYLVQFADSGLTDVQILTARLVYSALDIMKIDEPNDDSDDPR